MLVFFNWVPICKYQLVENYIIGGKVNVASLNVAGGTGGFLRTPPSGGFRGRSALRKFLGSKEHLDWFKIDFNAAEINTVRDNNKKN